MVTLTSSRLSLDLARRCISTIKGFNLFRLRANNVNRSDKNGFTLKKKKRWYAAETITDTDNLALLTIKSDQAKCLLHSVEQEVRDNSYFVNTIKVVFIHDKQQVSGLSRAVHIPQQQYLILTKLSLTTDEQQNINPNIRDIFIA